MTVCKCGAELVYSGRGRRPAFCRARCRGASESERRRVLPLERWCTECGKLLEGKARLVCSRRCADARYVRLHPEAFAAKRRRHDERVRARRGIGRGIERLGVNVEPEDVVDRRTPPVR